ncbi:hypothetical protein Zmor_004702 [Zophobas morio]|uniref:Ubiquitin-like domain-containing protein n=1 Tax=Zophobas morio TaxID=2755281 RepID=A0AA38MKU8_9CUCU|nr:hypothetical protein Zmor_004702 [Zophobas morio]
MKLVLLFAAVVIIAEVCAFTVNISYVNGNGETENHQITDVDQNTKVKLVRDKAANLIGSDTASTSLEYDDKLLKDSNTLGYYEIENGAIFTEDQRDSATELAFKYAVYKINKDKTLLPYTSLVYDIQYVPRDDSFHASKKACNQVQFGVHAVFGPSDPLLGAHIHSICDALDIPHLEARLDLDTDVREFSINLHPAQHLLNTAFQDVMAFLNWTKVAIIYEEDYGLIKLRELVRSPHNHDLEIHLRQADPESYRAVLKEIKSKEIHNIVIDTKPSNMQHFLKGILQLQMNDYKYHYLFTTFDMETFDLEDFKYNFVNMTAFRVVDVADLAVQEVLRDMARFQASLGSGVQANASYIQPRRPLLWHLVREDAVNEGRTPLIYDSVQFSPGNERSSRETLKSLPPFAPPS